MHILAYIYRWERDTIMSLRRKERRMWVEMIKEQKEAENDEIEEAQNKK